MAPALEMWAYLNSVSDKPEGLGVPKPFRVFWSDSNLRIPPAPLSACTVLFLPVDLTEYHIGKYAANAVVRIH